MRVFLDDIRNPPSDEWEVVRTHDEAIALLKTGLVTEISLDHDLGDPCKTGYDVATWIEAEVWMRGFYPPIVRCHSANPVGHANILACINSIDRGNKFHR